jgi:hypothetical protein
MNRTQFMQGMGAGLLMGAAVGYAMAPRKRRRCSAWRARPNAPYPMRRRMSAT